jgi:hypothetical protein
MDHATCDIVGCDRPLAVGVGQPPKWVCQTHFVEYLQDAARIRDMLMEGLKL